MASGPGVVDRLKPLLGIIAVGAAVALTYHVFENVVHGAIDLVWYDWAKTDSNRWVVIPLALLLALAYFGAQHVLDRNSEVGKAQGLGSMPVATMGNFIKVLGLGFLSLLAGASLGPEAILVPASMILGTFVGNRISKQPQAVRLLGAAGMMALFTAFFHSFLVGVLSVLLVTRQAKTKLSFVLLLTALLASAASYYTLELVSGEGLLEMPAYDWRINVVTVLLSVGLAAAGFLIIHGMEYLHKIFEEINVAVRANYWWVRALLAGSVIAALYLLGGPLVEFTGNLAIKPMFSQAAELGLFGLVWILIIKLVVISWSKSIGYRGGMIFPTIFVAAVLVAIMQSFVSEFNLIYGLIAVLVGAFVANTRTHTLV